MWIKFTSSYIAAYLVLAIFIGCVHGPTTQINQPSSLANKELIKRNKCSNIRPIKVGNKEFIHKGSKYLEVKEAIINQCKIDAVKQIIGAEIRANSRMDLQATKSDINEKYSELNIERAKGLIDSYVVLSENIVKLDDSTSLLEIETLVYVCEPSRKGLNEVVVIGRFITSNGNEESYRAMLKASLDKYNVLQIASYEPGDDIYYDLIIQGRLIEIVDSKGKRSDAFEKAIAAEFLGILSRDAGNTLRRSSREIVKKIRAVVQLEALKKFDKESINVMGQATVEIPSNLKPEIAKNNAVQGAIDAAARELIRKILTK